MEKFILRYIDFNKCYSYVLLNAFVWILSVALVATKSIPQKPIQTALHVIGFCLMVYIYLGFVKYSILQKKDTFRKLIFIAMVFSVTQSSIAITATLVDNIQLYNYNGIPVAIEAILLQYAFRAIQNEKIIYFRKLARIYLYLSIFYVPGSLDLLFGDKTPLHPYLIKPIVILVPFLAALIVYALYLKMRAFKQISTQMY